MPKIKDSSHKTKIGGQALIEGIMMRGPEKGALAVRQTDGGVYFEEWTLSEKKWYQKAPFIRGIFNFVLQMADGFKYISISAEKSGMLDEEEIKSNKNQEKTNENSVKETPEDKNDNSPKKQEESKFMDFMMTLAMIIGVGLAILLFMFVPTWIYSGISSFFKETDISPYRSLFEGIIKILVFIGYLWLTSLLKDIRVTYEYHGAEHKTIAAYEAGEELTAENIKKYKRFHPRCGTSFVFLTLAISILLYSVVPINSEIFMRLFGLEQFAADAVRVAFKLLLLPILVGISYEVLRFAGRSDSVVMKIVSAPGMAIQRLTTKEPSDKQIEIAIIAMKPVIPTDKELDKW